MLKGTTSAGFEFEISDETLDNFEIVEQMLRYEDGYNTAFWRVCYLMLGDDGMRALREICADEDGNVKTSVMREQLDEIMSTKPVKN